MRWALESEHEVDSGNWHCGIRRRLGAVKSRVEAARAVDGEPHDAVKSRGGRARRVDREPSSAAKGGRAASTRGEIRC